MPQGESRLPQVGGGPQAVCRVLSLPSCCSPGLYREAVVTPPAPSKSQEKAGGLELSFVI